MEYFLRDFRVHLRNELEARQQRNSAYSLRSFARDLSLSPGALSNYLSGRKQFSSDKLKELTQTLKLSAEESEAYATPVEKIEFESVSKEEAAVMDHWFFTAVRMLDGLKDFEPTKEYIIEKFGITEAEYQSFMGTLRQLGAVKEEEGVVATSHFPINTIVHGSDTQSEVKNRYKTRTFEQAIAVSLSRAPQEYAQSAGSLLVNESDLPEAINEINLFKRNFLAKYGNKSGEKDQIYQMLLSFHPLTF